MKIPRVSIIVPMHNASRYVIETLDSVRNQTCTDWELLVVDDGSTDASPALVADYLSRHGKGVLLRHPRGENRGTSASRNLGAEEACGDLLCFLDADDIWEPLFLESFLRVFDEEPEVAMAYCPALLWHAGAPAQDKPQRPGIRGGRVGDPLLLFKQFLVGSADTPSPSGIMVRRRALADAGGWEAAFRGMYDDQVLYSKLLLARVGVYFIDRCLYRYRQHEESLCHRADRERMEPAARKVYLDWLKRYLADRGKMSEDFALTLAEHLWYLRRRETPASNPVALMELFREQEDWRRGGRLLCRVLRHQAAYTIGKIAKSRNHKCR